MIPCKTLNPLEQAVRLELIMWANVPEELRGRTVSDIDELNQITHVIPYYSQWREVYLRQHRNKRRPQSLPLEVPLSVTDLAGNSINLETDEHGITKGYDIFSIHAPKFGLVFHNVGYGCGECNKIIVGQPIVKKGITNSFLEYLRSGGQTEDALIYFCGNCSVEMDNFEFENLQGLEQIHAWSNGASLHEKGTLTRDFG